MKCFRCHANGNDKGGFKDMQNFPKLLASKYVNLEEPDKSLLYTTALNYDMPPDVSDILSTKELDTLLFWLEDEARKRP